MPEQVRRVWQSQLAERFTLDQARAWVAAGTVFIPTLGLHQREADLMNGEANLDDPTLAHDAPASVIDELRAFSEAPHDATSRARVLEVQANVLANFAILLEADAVILSGSDAGIFGSVHGRSLVDELVAFVENGMPNAQALASATALAAEYLGRGDLGRITVGATADFLIVDGDPTVSIDALRSVRAVYLGGSELSREDLEVDRGLPLETDPARRAPDDGHCLRVSECGATETCIRLYLCAARCEDSSECAPGTFCGRDIADGRGCYPSWDCDPLAQNCGNGLACQPMTNGATFCGAAGSAGVGESCDNTSLATTCARGTRCEAGTCEALCSLAGTDCAAPQTCVTLEPETGVAVGACR